MDGWKKGSFGRNRRMDGWMLLFYSTDWFTTIEVRMNEHLGGLGWGLGLLLLLITPPAAAADSTNGLARPLPFNPTNEP